MPVWHAWHPSISGLSQDALAGCILNSPPRLATIIFTEEVYNVSNDSLDQNISSELHV